MVLQEEFARWGGEPTLPLTAIPGFEIELEWGVPTHTVNISSALAGATDPLKREPTARAARVPLLQAIPTTNFDTLQAARQSLESCLGDWSLYLDLNEMLWVRFELRSAIAASSDGEWQEVLWESRGGISLDISKPIPQVSLPKMWGVHGTPLVDQLCDQWRQFRVGKALLLDRAYCCLTFIERAYGGRPAAAQRLSVSRNVLDRIGTLTASSDPRHARKAGGGPAALQPADIRFLSAALPRLIFRVAEVESAMDVQHLSLDDFRTEH